MTLSDSVRDFQTLISSFFSIGLKRDSDTFRFWHFHVSRWIKEEFFKSLVLLGRRPWSVRLIFPDIFNGSPKSLGSKSIYHMLVSTYFIVNRIKKRAIAVFIRTYSYVLITIRSDWLTDSITTRRLLYKLRAGKINQPVLIRNGVRLFGYLFIPFPP